MTDFLNLPCIAISQGNGRRLFAFGMDGKKLPLVAQVSRLTRSSEDLIAGYQRPEVMSHIAEIRNYLETANPILPNGIVVAFDSSVKYTPSKSINTNSVDGEHGHLRIPILPAGEPRPGWIVDGQQRSAALRDAKVESFPVFVLAFTTDRVEEQREQFILVNSTKPLPKGLIYELLPGTDVSLSSQLQRKRFPAYLLERLNFDSRSPLHRSIKTPTSPNGFIQDNSILRMLGNSLNDGALCRIANSAGEDESTEAMLSCLFSFWRSVINVFPEDWGLPPRRSRLTHGVGIISLGYLMDAIYDRHRAKNRSLGAIFERELRTISPECSWRMGFWEFGPGQQRKWSDLQNTSKDIQLLANYLMIRYRVTSGNPPLRSPE